MDRVFQREKRESAKVWQSGKKYKVVRKTISMEGPEVFFKGNSKR